MTAGCDATAEKRAARESTEHVRELVARAQQGDRDALEELYLIHFDRIYSYLHVSVGNRHDAEDLTTQTFLKMLESIGTLPLAVGAVLGLALPDRAQPRDGPLPRAPPLAARGGGARAAGLGGAVGRARGDAVDRPPVDAGADRKLSPEQQQVLTLKFVFNFPNAEVATILDKTEGAIKSLQHRALASLQKQIARTDQ